MNYYSIRVTINKNDRNFIKKTMINVNNNGKISNYEKIEKIEPNNSTTVGKRKIYKLEKVK
jgi:diacylglycerol kinase family enzyme